MSRETRFIEIILPAGIGKSRPVAFARRPVGGGWRSDAVVAVCRGGGRTIYPAAINLSNEEVASGKVFLRPSHLDPFRDLVPKVIGWAERPDIGWKGPVRPNADVANWDPDGVSAPSVPGTVSPAPAPVMAIALHAFARCSHPGQHGYGLTPPICERCRNPEYDRAHCQHPRASADHDHRLPDLAPVCADCGAGLPAILCDAHRTAQSRPCVHSGAVSSHLHRSRDDAPICADCGGLLVAEQVCTLSGCGRTEDEICRTCGARYPAFGDGEDGECPDCADRRYTDAEVEEAAVVVDPLTCSTCGHPIEDHRPGEYGRDVCVGAGYRQPSGVVCLCEGFALAVAPTEANTRIEYRYRDADGYQANAAIVLAGRFSSDGEAAFRDHLAAASRQAGVDPDNFVPTDLLLPPAQYLLWERDERDDAEGSEEGRDISPDHVYNVLTGISATSDPADPTAPSLTTLLLLSEKAAVGGWDISRAMHLLDLEGGEFYSFEPTCGGMAGPGSTDEVAAPNESADTSSSQTDSAVVTTASDDSTFPPCTVWMQPEGRPCGALATIQVDRGSAGPLFACADHEDYLLRTWMLGLVKPRDR